MLLNGTPQYTQVSATIWLSQAPRPACAGQVRHAAGEGLVLAMRQVPPVFFTEDFSLARRASLGRTFFATNAMSCLPFSVLSSTLAHGASMRQSRV